MTTPTPIRHPWFDPPSTKRRLSGSATPSSSKQHPPKRRKLSVLESGFAQLTLNNPLDSTTDAPCHSPGWPCISEFVQAPRELLSATETNVKVPAHDVILPSCVEEPIIPDVKMKTSSWYEPEPDRIVVTDLESLLEDDDESAELDISSISISRPLLQRLALHAKRLVDTPPCSSQALVLYRPLRHGAILADDSKSNEGIIGTTGSEVIGEDNSMEVDPW